MVVCAHSPRGEVAGFCEKHGIEIFETHDGDLDSYGGSCAVIVTDEQMTREQYESLKCAMFGRGLEVISTEWTDDAIIVALLRQKVESRRKRGGRQMFGFYKRNGAVVENPAMMAVARRILKLRDAGFTYREISEDPKVRHHNGKKMAVSTIQKVVANREFYEQE